MEALELRETPEILVSTAWMGEMASLVSQAVKEKEENLSLASRECRATRDCLERKILMLTTVTGGHRDSPEEKGKKVSAA